MKAWLTLAVLFLGCLTSFSQIRFEKGYFIDNSDQKTECLIKNVEWKNNPDRFEYKLNENAEIKTAAIGDVKEFRISEAVTYRRFTVKIDKSSSNINNLSDNKNLEYQEETLFLKLLVSGTANLYYYEEGDIRRFFYNVNNSEVAQLIYKPYAVYINSVKRLMKNNGFRHQLYNEMSCGELSLKEVEELEYVEKDLSRYFIKYNKCADASYNDVVEKKKGGDAFNLSVHAGVNFVSLTINNTISAARYTDFGNLLGYRAGFAAELILPFHQNKWSVLMEPSFQYVSSEKQLLNDRAEFTYKSLELPLGIRHYFFLNQHSKIFLNGLWVINQDLDSKVRYEGNSGQAILEISPDYNLAFGAGYTNKSRFSLELRYGFRRNLLTNYAAWKSEYKVVSVIAGFNIF